MTSNLSKQSFWDAGYKHGFDYRSLFENELEEILRVADKAKTALDLGCGIGEVCRQLHSRALQTTGVDISPVAIEKARKLSPPEIEFQVFDFEEKAISSLGKFDLLTCKLVLAFVADKQALIENMADALNSGGVVAIVNPVLNADAKGYPPKLDKISVDDDITLKLLRPKFDLIKRLAAPSSDQHKVVVYVAKLK